MIKKASSVSFLFALGYIKDTPLYLDFDKRCYADNMREVGYIIYWCYTKRNYQGECKYHPPLKVKEYMKHIPPDVLDLLNYILHKG